LGDRWLLDSVLVAKELAKEAKSTNKRCVIVKVDYEKAYD